jgi:hypothetical protein
MALTSGSMQNAQSKDYFERRADEERVAADKAADERAAQSHRELARHYRNIASGSEEAPGRDVEAPAQGILPREFRIVP